MPVRADIFGFYSSPVAGCHKSNWDNPKQRETIKKRLTEREEKDIPRSRFIDSFLEVAEKYDESNSDKT